jgi:hypothetical protein
MLKIPKLMELPVPGMMVPTDNPFLSKSYVIPISDPDNPIITPVSPSQ